MMIGQRESMKSILSRFAGPSPSSRGNASAPKEKAPVPKGRGLKIRMECRRQRPLLQLQYQGGLVCGYGSLLNGISSMERVK